MPGRENGYIKEGGFPVDRPHLKGVFDRKVGKLLSGPGSPTLSGRNYKVRFSFWINDKKNQEYSDTWIFDPSFIELA